MIKPSKEQIREGRLLKKIGVLKKRIDNLKDTLSHYEVIFKMHPFIERGYQSYQEKQIERKINSANAKRILEQEKLIDRLLKESNETPKNNLP